MEVLAPVIEALQRLRWSRRLMMLGLQTIANTFMNHTHVPGMFYEAVLGCASHVVLVRRSWMQRLCDGEDDCAATCCCAYLAVATQQQATC